MVTNRSAKTTKIGQSEVIGSLPLINPEPKGQVCLSMANL